MNIHECRHIRRNALIVIAAVLHFLVLSLVNSATLEEIKNFGDNPSNLNMFLYVPDDIPENVPVLVGLHWCHGTAHDYFNGNKYRYLADEHKFIVIYPNANSADSCFDVHSEETLTHNGGGDSKSIISMVHYVLEHYSTDSNRVFVTGHSSGGMITNVMAGSYPDVFAAASASAGVPFGCFAGSNTWNGSCAEGRIDHTPQEWSDIVKSAFPEYEGTRPRMQLWHGTNDNVLRFHNFNEAIEQWTYILGVSLTPSSTEQNTPMSTYIRTRYRDSSGTVMVEAIEATGEGHNCRIDEEEVVGFFGLDEPPTQSRKTADNGNKKGGGYFAVSTSERGITWAVKKPVKGYIRVEMFTVTGRKIRTLYKSVNSNGIQLTTTEKDFIHSSGMNIFILIVNGKPIDSRLVAVSPDN